MVRLIKAPSKALYSTVQYSTVQYSTVRLSKLRQTSQAAFAASSFSSWLKHHQSSLEVCHLCLFQFMTFYFAMLVIILEWPPPSFRCKHLKLFMQGCCSRRMILAEFCCWNIFLFVRFWWRLWTLEPGGDISPGNVLRGAPGDDCDVSFGSEPQHSRCPWWWRYS